MLKSENKLYRLLILIIILFVAVDNIINNVLLKGVNNYFGLNQYSELLLLGHSHLMLATDKERLERETGMQVSKYCREGVNVSDKKAMIEHFLNNGYADSLKYVLYGVDLATFTGDGLSKNSYTLFYPFMDNKSIDNYIKEHASSIDYWVHKLIKSTRYNDDGVKNSAIRGWMNNWDNLKSNTIDIESYRRQLEKGDERHIKMNSELMRQFDESIQMITERGVKVILVNTPTLDLLNDFEPDKYTAIIKWYHCYAANNPMVEFWDFNPDYASDYSIFSDRLHLNSNGQKIITDELVKRIKTLN